MDEAIDYPARLMTMAETDSLNGADLVGAARLIRRLAAEVERLTPKPMTLQDAINVLNAHAYGDGRWSLDEQYGLFAVDPYRRTLTTYDAVAIAEKLLREKEASGG